MESLRNLFRKKMRSVITISGIVIGVLALVIMGGMAGSLNMLVKGARQYLSNDIMVSPKEISSTMFGLKTPFSEKYSEELRKVDGVKVVRSEISLLYDENQSTINMSMPSEINGFNINEYKESLKYMDSDFEFSFMSGDWWKDGETGTAVFGISLAKQLDLSVGDTIENRGNKFKIVGILNRTMTAPDSMMFIPLEDARVLLAKSQPLLNNLEDQNYVTSLIAVAEKGKASEVTEKINSELPHLNAIDPEQSIAEIESQMSMLNLVITACGFIALIVGGLSIINTMLMSVMERFKEIGLKKTIGAGTWDILKEYILEATFIGFISGLIGLSLGWLITTLVNYLTSSSGSELFLITPDLAIGSFVFAIVISVFAGIYPAYKAATIDPIKALKSE